MLVAAVVQIKMQLHLDQVQVAQAAAVTAAMVLRQALQVQQIQAVVAAVRLTLAPAAQVVRA